MRKLSILIPTVENRREDFKLLQIEFIRQIHEAKLDFATDIEILHIRDNKEISIGAKRQKLYEMATGLYSVQFDDDDMPEKTFIRDVWEAMKQGADCITYQEYCTFNGVNPKTSNFSLKYLDWADKKDGFDYVRTPFFKCPIKTHLCLEAGVRDMRYGEDHDFAKRIKILLKTETHISKNLYLYRYKHEDFEGKYGIKKKAN